MHNDDSSDERGRMQLRGGGVQIIFHRLKSFSLRINDAPELRIHGWDKQLAAEYAVKNILFCSFIQKKSRFASSLTSRDNRRNNSIRRCLKDCSTLCRRLPGREISITANFGSFGIPILIPPPTLTQNSTLITTGSWNCYIDDLLRHKISTADSFEIVTHRGTKRISSPRIRQLLDRCTRKEEMEMVFWRDCENDWS